MMKNRAACFVISVMGCVLSTTLGAFEQQLGLGFGNSQIDNSQKVVYNNNTFGTTTLTTNDNVIGYSGLHLKMSHDLIQYHGPWFIGWSSSITSHLLKGQQRSNGWQAGVNAAVSTEVLPLLNTGVLVGQKFSPWCHLIGHLGSALGAFRSRAHGTNGSAGDLGYSGHFTKIMPGVSTGFGLRIVLNPRLFLQSDYSYASFAAFHKSGVEPGTNDPTNGVIASTQSRYKLSAHLLSFSAVYTL